MAQNDFTEDKATLFGAGMVTVGVFGKTALITKGVGVVAATKPEYWLVDLSVLLRRYLYRFSLCWGRVDKSFRQAKLLVKFITGTINSFRIPHICHVESGMIKKFYVIICGFLRKGKNKI